MSPQKAINEFSLSVMHYTFQLVQFLVHSSISGMLVWSPAPPPENKNLGRSWHFEFDLVWSTPHPPTATATPEFQGARKRRLISVSPVDTISLFSGETSAYHGIDLLSAAPAVLPRSCSSCSFTKILQLYYYDQPEVIFTSHYVYSRNADLKIHNGSGT